MRQPCVGWNRISKSYFWISSFIQITLKFHDGRINHFESLNTLTQLSEWTNLLKGFKLSEREPFRKACWIWSFFPVCAVVKLHAQCNMFLKLWYAVASVPYYMIKSFLAHCKKIYTFENALWVSNVFTFSYVHPEWENFFFPPLEQVLCISTNQVNKKVLCYCKNEKDLLK